MAMLACTGVGCVLLMLKAQLYPVNGPDAPVNGHKPVDAPPNAVNWLYPVDGVPTPR